MSLASGCDRSPGLRYSSPGEGVASKKPSRQPYEVLSVCSLTCAMELLDGFLHELNPVWGQKNRSLLIGEPMISPNLWDGVISSPVFMQICDNSRDVKGFLGCLTPCVGLGTFKPDFEIVVEGHKSNSQFQVGTWVGFCNFAVNRIDNNKAFISFSDDTKMWTISEFDSSFPVSFLHLFCGGFNGWERATRWMECNKIVSIQSEVSIDRDEQAMRVWQLRSKGELIFGNIRHDFATSQKHVGCVAAVSQMHWTNLSRSMVNAIITCSPPCVSWSKGGKSQGLECEAGVAFSESIQKIRILRPSLVLFECADKVTQHPHYKIIRLALQIAGYRQVWSQVVPFDSLANMARTRWLAIWSRADISDVQTLGSFRLVDVHRSFWSSLSYDFSVPRQIQHQMKLSKEMKKIYGDPQFLPQSKKSQHGFPSEGSEVLKLRCLKDSEVMPTLCASYSQQHHIDASHLMNKGIYAVLNFVHDDFQFFSPLLFVAMLGATIVEPVFIPVKLSIAFLQIGNAISVPHAVLTLAVAFVATKIASITISQTVMKAWGDRMTTANTIVFRCKDFCVMCPLQLLPSVLPFHNMCMIVSNPTCVIAVHDTLLNIALSGSAVLLDVFKQLGFEKEALKNVMCTSNGTAIPWDTPMLDINGVALSFVKLGITFLQIKCTFSACVSECDSLDLAIGAEIDAIEQSCLSEPFPILPCIDDSQEDRSAKRICTGLQQDSCSTRSLLFSHQGIPLATDELEWIIREFAPAQMLHIVQIVANEWNQVEEQLRKIISIHDGKKLVKCMCLFENHWFAVEIRKKDAIEFFCINTPKDKRFTISQFFQQWDGVNGFKGSFGFSESSYSHGFCGWELLFHWFGIVVPQYDLHVQEISSFIASKGKIAGEQPKERYLVSIWKAVCSARFHFLTSLPKDHSVEGIKIGLAANDQEMGDAVQEEAAKAPDPWSNPLQDPWNQAKRACKWEDLKLPDDHHFQDSKGNRIPQIHRQQISAKTSGIAFATKSSVIDIFALSPPKETALLLPNSDKIAFPQLHSVSITGPFEIIVRDGSLNSVYKRQVLLLQVGQNIVFELPKATYNAITAEFRELVIEIDERLISKDLAAAIAAKPLETIKARLVEQIPPLASKSLGVFGFRLVKVQSSKDQHKVFQAICEIHADQRVYCLERSGAGDVFIRDHVAKGDMIEDLTIIPRFWEADRLSKDDALRAASSIPGFAGLVHTRRGIAVRAWCKQVISVRKILLAQDERISELNHGVIPRCIRDSTGWPSTVGPQEIVKASIHGTGLPPIPTRCYKSQGVTTWTLAFDSPPKVDKFMIQLNSRTFEIILTVPNEKPAPPAKTKKGGFVKGQKSPPSKDHSNVVEEPKDDQNAQRISALEAKFSSMERRQDSLEGRINEGFHSVNDQLRQVLAAIQPRGATSHTGMTPPSKTAKTA